MATMAWQSNQGAATRAIPLVANTADSMRDKADAVRDTLFVLAIQLIFRAMLLLRRWNY